MPNASYLAWPQVKGLIENGCAAILAIGAQEQHGPHAPLATDTIMAEGLALRLSETTGTLLLPSIPYGDAWNNSRFPGTISLSFNTVKSIISDIISALKNSGVKGLVIVNGHYGNRAPIEIACQELEKQFHFPVLMLNYPGMERLAAEICESKPAAFSFYHADEFETSIVLALRPEAVNMKEAAAVYPEFPPAFGSEQIYLDSFNPSGVFGDPRKSTAEKGEKLLEGLTDEAMKIVLPFLERILA